MIAWKIDSKLSVLVKTDVKHLSQLIFASFVHNNYIINDYLSLTRIQTVDVDGEPQDINEILSHSKKDILLRTSELLSPPEWDRHLDGIKSLGVLANQASEFEYKKNLTEGKTGVVQPDLISSKTIEESLIRKKVTSPDTPKKRILSLEKTGEKIQELKQDLKKKNDADATATSTSSLSSYDTRSLETILSLDSPKFPLTPVKSPTQSIKSRISNEPASPKFPLQSPAKKAFFGKEAKAVETSSIVDSAKDLVDSVIKEVKANPDVAAMENGSSSSSIKVSDSVSDKEATKSFLSNEKSESEVLANSEVMEVIAKSPVKESTISFLSNEQEQCDVMSNKSETVEEENIAPKEEEEQEEAKVELTTPTKAEAAPEAPMSQPKKHSQSNKPRRQKLIDAKPPNVLVYSDSTTTRGNVIKTLGGILKANTYTIYPLTAQQVRERVWLENTTLLVVCGSVNGSDVSKIFLEFFFKGGKVLCLCSDLLRQVLPTYHTAEVRKLFC
jgi:biotin--protein ligase